MTVYQDFLTMLPLHLASLNLIHNDHKGYYRSVEEAIIDNEFGYTEECWISDTEKQRSIASNECWIIQWYPDTPVGFHVKSACSLEALLEHIFREFT